MALIAFAKRPLKLPELRDALANSQVQFQNLESIDGDQIERDCVPFIDFYSPRGESEDGYFRVRHAFLSQFMRTSHEARISAAEHPAVNPNVIAETCLCYLSQQRYSDLTMEPPSSHSFLGYALKYWHRHLDEVDRNPTLIQKASSFLRSPQFISITRFQSLLLERHFRGNFGGKKQNSGFRMSSLNVPQSVRVQEAMRSDIDDYRDFAVEWSGLLSLGTTESSLAGKIEHCFWGALGEKNILRTHGKSIEKNDSFSLDFDMLDQDGLSARHTSGHTFYSSVSEDGSRVTVWGWPAQDNSKTESNQDDYKLLLKESWRIDGDTRPHREEAQEILLLNKRRTRWDDYGSHSDGEYPLIPTLDSLPQVGPFQELEYADTARVGRHLFYREKDGSWKSDDSVNDNGSTYWDDILIRNSWIVRSCRKHVNGAIREQDQSAEQEKKIIEPPVEPRKNMLPDNDTSRSQNSVPPGDDLEEFDFDSYIDQPTDIAQNSQLDVETQSSDEIQSLDSEMFVSSAEEYCLASHSEDSSESEDSTDDLWLSSEGENGIEDEKTTDDDDKSTTSSSSTPSVSSRASRRAKKSKFIRVTPKEPTTVDQTERWDADDESSGSESEHDDNEQNDERPLHAFSPSIYCDICGNAVLRTEYQDLGYTHETFHQCSRCGREGDSYDICSGCFDKGVWCKEPNHLLSKAIVRFRERQINWEDRISQHTAPPLVKIVAGSRESVAVPEGSPSVLPCFRYTRRHADMLHESRPSIHPTLPLLVYPLDGRYFLFGNLQDNTYFTFDVPFYIGETAETSGNRCIPISVELHFSPCGKLLHILRFTARNDSTLYSDVRLHVVSLTIALSSTDACSRKPQLLSDHQDLDLGPYSSFIQSLPYSVTWTDSHAYVSMSLDLLRVCRFQLHRKTPDKEHEAGDVHVYSREVPLPHSARFRVVKFFPSENSKPARLILGSLRGSRPRPPAVVYLETKQTIEWVSLQEMKERTSRDLLTTRDDPLMEEPYVDDDGAFCIKNPKPEEAVTIEPMIPFRHKLETGFQDLGIYCPCCFQISLKLNFLRMPTLLSFHVLRAFRITGIFFAVLLIIIV